MPPELPFPPRLIRRIGGFGGAQTADSYVATPDSADEIAPFLNLAQRQGQSVALRGAGRSYGDAAYLSESWTLDLSELKSMEFDAETGIAIAEAGVTIGDLWRTGLESGWWPPVVSGTQFPTIGGALAMNIHGKNATRAGTLGEHTLWIDVAFPNGSTRRLTPDDDLFFEVISSAGQLGMITRAAIQLRRVQSGDLDVTPVHCRNWDEQFAAFEEFQNADYRVTWIDAFAKGASAGAGLFHAGSYVDEDDPETRLLINQDLPTRIAGVVPKNQVWRILKALNGRGSMRALNLAKRMGGRLKGDRRPFRQSLVAFSFLLDYVPNWQRAYAPGGFIQYQSFVPQEHAKRVFEAQIQLQQAERMESYLAVMKRHREDRFLFSHGVDGFSLALDFKVTDENRERLWAMCHRMNELVLEANGKFYLAKDSTLTASAIERWLGEEKLARYRRLKLELDPSQVLRTEQAKRLGL